MIIYDGNNRKRQATNMPTTDKLDEEISNNLSTIYVCKTYTHVNLQGRERWGWFAREGIYNPFTGSANSLMKEYTKYMIGIKEKWFLKEYKRKQPTCKPVMIYKSCNSCKKDSMNYFFRDTCKPNFRPNVFCHWQQAF